MKLALPDRLAEGEEYVPLVLRANELWKEIERDTGKILHQQTGILIMASNAVDTPNKFVDNTIKAAKKYGIRHTELTADQINARFSQIRLNGDEKGYFEDAAGFLRPEVCIETQLELAERYGADIQTEETYLSYEQNDDGITVITDKASYVTDKLVLTVGPWVNTILPDSYKDAIKIYRQILYWFEIQDAKQYQVDNFPVFNWEFNTAHEDFMYGFPSLDGKTIKVATEQYAETTHPDTINRLVSNEEIKIMYKHYVSPHLAGLSGRCVKAEACLYSVAPDWRFLIDYHPDNRNIIIASPCSGHGFKHSSAIGEVIADMVIGNPTKVDISEFSFSKLVK